MRITATLRPFASAGFRRGLVALLLQAAIGALAPAWAQTAEAGVAGASGLKADTGGIGGTGKTGGIGGTGAPISVYGPIDRLGSVFLNGREYRIDSHTMIAFDGRPTTAATLRVGDMVRLHGVAIGNHGGYASAISASTAIIGPVGAISPDGGSFMVLGQRVAASTGRQPFAGIRLGDRVGVSGQRLSDGVWVAHRVAVLPASSTFRLETTIKAIQTNRIVLPGLTLRVRPGILEHFHPGERIVATGVIVNGAPRLARLTPQRLDLGAPGTMVEVRDYFRSVGGGRLVAPDGIAATGAPAGVSLNGLRAVEIGGHLSGAETVQINHLQLDPPRAPELSGTDARSDDDADSSAVTPAESGDATERALDGDAPADLSPPVNVEPPEVDLPEGATEPGAEPPEVEVPEVPEGPTEPAVEPPETTGSEPQMPD